MDTSVRIQITTFSYECYWLHSYITIFAFIGLLYFITLSRIRKERTAMSKFNNEATNKTVNNCGHTAYAMPDKDKLLTQVLTSFFNEEKFYGDNSGEIIETGHQR